MSRNKPLEYDRSSSPYATRRQFRLLLLLVAIQLALSVQLAFVPGLWGEIRQYAAKRRQAMAQAAQLKAALALEQKCLQCTEPADKIIWDEYPETASKLFSLPGYTSAAIKGTEQFPHPDRFPHFARADPPPLFGKIFPELEMAGAGPHAEYVRDTLVFFHGRKTPVGVERLVFVYLRSFDSVGNCSIPAPTDREWTAELSHDRTLIGDVCGLKHGNGPPDLTIGHSAFLHLAPSGSWNSEPRQGRLLLTWHPPAARGQSERIQIDWRRQLRLYAGQADPTDPSHFTIGAVIDGKPTVIDGWLRDEDTMEFKVRTGHMPAPDQWEE